MRGEEDEEVLSIERLETPAGGGAVLLLKRMLAGVEDTIRKCRFGLTGERVECDAGAGRLNWRGGRGSSFHMRGAGGATAMRGGEFVEFDFGRLGVVAWPSGPRANSWRVFGAPDAACLVSGCFLLGAVSTRCWCAAEEQKTELLGGSR